MRHYTHLMMGWLILWAGLFSPLCYSARIPRLINYQPSNENYNYALNEHPITAKAAEILNQLQVFWNRMMNAGYFNDGTSDIQTYSSRRMLNQIYRHSGLRRLLRDFPLPPSPGSPGSYDPTRYDAFGVRSPYSATEISDLIKKQSIEAVYHSDSLLAVVGVAFCVISSAIAYGVAFFIQRSQNHWIRRRHLLVYSIIRGIAVMGLYLTFIFLEPKTSGMTGADLQKYLNERAPYSAIVAGYTLLDFGLSILNRKRFIHLYRVIKLKKFKSRYLRRLVVDPELDVESMQTCLICLEQVPVFNPAEPNGYSTSHDATAIENEPTESPNGATDQTTSTDNGAGTSEQTTITDKEQDPFFYTFNACAHGGHAKCLHEWFIRPQGDKDRKQWVCFVCKRHLNQKESVEMVVLE